MKKKLRKDYAALCNSSAVEGSSELLFGDLSKLAKDISEANKLTKKVRPSHSTNSRGDKYGGRSSYGSSQGNRRFHPYSKGKPYDFLGKSHFSKKGRKRTERRLVAMSLTSVKATLSCCSSFSWRVGTSEQFNLMSWKRKNEQEGKQFWRLSLKVLNLPSSLLRCCGGFGSNFISFSLKRMFFFPNLIFCIKIWSRGLAATLWFRGTTHTQKRDVYDSGSGCFCKPRLVKSSKANSTPPIWLHFPLPCEPSPAGQVQAARDTSHWGVNSTTTR